MNEIPKRTDAQVVRELARDAKSLKDDRAFKAAAEILRRQWQAELLTCPPEEMLAARAKIVALDGLWKMLDHLIVSGKMSQGTPHG